MHEEAEDDSDLELENDRFSELHSRWVRTNTEGRKQLQDDGVDEWRRGRWSAEEVKILKRNVKAFTKAENITDLSAFLFSEKKGTHKVFYRSIARDIERPLFAVYRKMLRVFDVSNHVGKWTKKNERRLLRLHVVHGNRWATIGKKLGVSARAAQDKFRSLDKRKKKGAWSEDEEEKLASAVQELSGYSSLSPKESLPPDFALPPDISWSQVAEIVGSRNAPQCRSKWFFDLAWKKGGGVKPWDFQDDLKLLRLLSTMDVSEEDEVEWAELCKGWDSARSPFYLRNRWACLRRSVPSYSTKSFEENLEHLLEYQLPSLERKFAYTFVQDESDSD